jgi:hypothetical protein
MRQFICPKCGEKTGVKIAYGYPGEEMIEQAKRKEIALGGCVQEIGAPVRQCLSCAHQWSIQRRSPDRLRAS